MKYNILISYRTGDSLHSYDTEDLLDGEWENKDIIKENLERIKEHYKWIKDKYSHISKNIDEPEWHKRKIPENSVVLKTDLGMEYLQSSFWCGYFETLYGAKAIPVKEEEMEFKL